MKIRLNNRLYQKDAIDAAIKAFKNVCECSVINDSFELEITGPNCNQKVADEFCNFVLGITKDCGFY